MRNAQRATTRATRRKASTRRAPGWWLSLGASIACGSFEEVSLGAAIGGGDSQGIAGSTSSGAAEAERVGGSDDSDGAANPFIDAPDLGVLLQCDHWTQDCPAGTKCTMWARDGGAWNATRCVPIVPDPDLPGEPCVAMGGGASGVDTCALGAVCWNVDRDTGVGVCRAQCEGSHAEPRCADPTLVCSGPRLFPLCVDVCCPLERECPPGQACYAHHSGFRCMPDASGEGGQFGAPCAFTNGCAPGHYCAAPGSVPNCSEGDGCCNAFCRVGIDPCSALHPAMTCVPWFAEGHAPPGFELTGVCAVVE